MSIKLCTSSSCLTIVARVTNNTVKWEMMCDYLTQEEIERLQDLSPQFEKEASRFLPWPVKFIRLLEAEREDPKTRTKGTEDHIACYYCFQIKEPGEFQMEQLQDGIVRTLRDPHRRGGPQKFYEPVHPEVAAASSRHSSVIAVSTRGPHNLLPNAKENDREHLRRYCIDCAIKMCLLVPSDLIETRTKVKIWICHCPRAQRYDKDSFCKDCKRGQCYRQGPSTPLAGTSQA